MSSESWDLVGAWYKFVEKETEGAQPQSPSGKPPLPSRQSLLTPFWLSVSTHPSHGLNGPCAPNSNPPGDVLGDGALGRCLGHEGIRALMNGISALIKETQIGEEGGKRGVGVLLSSHLGLPSWGPHHLPQESNACLLPPAVRAWIPPPTFPALTRPTPTLVLLPKGFPFWAAKHGGKKPTLRLAPVSSVGQVWCDLGQAPEPPFTDLNPG